MNEQNPHQIRVCGGNSVSVTTGSALSELLLLSSRLTRLAKADAHSSALRLAFAVGDLSASVVSGGSADDIASEVGDVILQALGIAALYGVSSDAILAELTKSAEVQVAKHIADVTVATLNDAGIATKVGNPVFI